MKSEEVPVTRMKILEVMKRAKFLKVDTKLIMKIDLSGLDHPVHVARVVDYLVTIVEKMPRQSLVGMVDFRGLTVSDEIKQELFRLTELTSTFFRAGALLASDARSRELAAAFTSRIGTTSLPVYEDEDPAKNWLIDK